MREGLKRKKFAAHPQMRALQGRHHARGLEAPESGRLKGVMGVQRDLRGEIAIPPGPSGPTGGAFSLGEKSNYNKLC